MTKNPVIALAGNPNVGKSTIFNTLTGARQHVGNWPGKTIEKKEGITDIGGQEVIIVDLPGAYSLSAYSIEEIITRNFILNEKPSAIIAVADASNLERNLYLVAQILELQAPLVLVLNMSDVAQAHGIHIDPALLSKRLGGIPIVKMVGKQGIGLDALKQALNRVIEKHKFIPHVPIVYDNPIETEIETLEAQIEADDILKHTGSARWLAIKLLEADEEILAQLEAAGHHDLLSAVQKAMERISAATGEDSETLIADQRYRFIGRALEGAIVRPADSLETRSDQIDKIVTHRIWGLPIFLLLMWLVFQFTANVSAPLLDWIDGVVSGPVTQWAIAIFEMADLSESWIASLVVDGIIAGVGGVLVFVPVLFFLYFAIAVLEDSGYMARAAFVMNDFMRTLGLHGKSFLPLLVGFGCTVPAVYATRTLENQADRKLTAFLTPFMSCGARLPVYVLFGAAFFGAQAGAMVFGMYILGVVVAVITGFALKATVFKNKPVPPFIMEMPPYRMPTLKGILLYIWKHVAEFLRKTTTVILAASIVLWFLMTVPASPNDSTNDSLENSLFGSISKMIAPLLEPAGFGNWESAGALMTGFVAKEVIVSSMGQIYLGAEETAATQKPNLGKNLIEIATSFGEALILTVQETINIVPRTINIVPGLQLAEAHLLSDMPTAEEDLSELENALDRAFTPLSAVAFNVFVLLYVPCMATVAAMRQEFDIRWTLYQVFYTLGIAWLAAVIVYQSGKILGLG